ncbi:nucleotidyltransferase domain-containing protein [Methylolobus aquaticus]|uniref:nucleotidyltransferase domain-containing protein n=1 Tax=Methylotetracoccus oryzae TaxID=1919059 RepID=UPI0010218D4D|nr:nucleotidyltransferase domain-containing protein [Methylotetracoccus oryzae]RYU56645.1 nucleotidyltransferase domain-containing protein [Methylolobus aquaticus]
MRLTPEQIETIRRTTWEIFGAEARVRLFGSRLDDSARGGDIDLLVEPGLPIAEPERKRLELVARLQLRMGDQPIDVLIAGPQVQPGDIYDLAQRQGVLL